MLPFLGDICNMIANTSNSPLLIVLDFPNLIFESNGQLSYNYLVVTYFNLVTNWN
jgi:hypothetical protein